MSEILHSIGRSLTAPMLFSALPETVRRALVERAPARRLADGQIIQQRGDMANEFWLIEQGKVAVGQFLPDGVFRAMALLGPGDSYGELALLSDRPRVVDAVSRGRSIVRAISGSAFAAALEAEPGVMRGLLATMALQLQEQLDLVAGIRRGAATARVASLLATLAGMESSPVEVRITQSELAELLGLTRATVNAALATLSDAGLIERGYGVITVRNPAALRHIDA